jgi:hypothetical protein
LFQANSPQQVQVTSFFSTKKAHITRVLDLECLSLILITKNKKMPFNEKCGVKCSTPASHRRRNSRDKEEEFEDPSTPSLARLKCCSGGICADHFICNTSLWHSDTVEAITETEGKN